MPEISTAGYLGQRTWSSPNMRCANMRVAHGCIRESRPHFPILIISRSSSHATIPSSPPTSRKRTAGAGNPRGFRRTPGTDIARRTSPARQDNISPVMRQPPKWAQSLYATFIAIMHPPGAFAATMQADVTPYRTSESHDIARARRHDFRSRVPTGYFVAGWASVPFSALLNSAATFLLPLLTALCRGVCGAPSCRYPPCSMFTHRARA